MTTPVKKKPAPIDPWLEEQKKKVAAEKAAAAKAKAATDKADKAAQAKGPKPTPTAGTAATPNLDNYQPPVSKFPGVKFINVPEPNVREDDKSAANLAVIAAIYAGQNAASNPTAANLKKYNEEKAKAKAAVDKVFSYSSDGNVKNIFQNDAGQSYMQDTTVDYILAQNWDKSFYKIKPTPAATPDANTGNILTWGQGTGKGASTTSGPNGSTLETLTNGTKILTLANGRRIFLDENNKPTSGLGVSGKNLTEKQITQALQSVNTPAASDTSGTTGDAGATGGTGGTIINNYNTGGGNANVPVAPAKKTASELMNDYAMQAAVINSDPSLKALFDKAVAEQMPPTAFAAALRNTDFYTRHGADWADARLKQLGDKGDWKAQLAKATVTIQQEATALGMSLDANDVAAIAKAGLFSSGGVANGIAPSWIDTHIAAYGKVTGKGGTTLDTINSLKTTGADMGIQHDDSWYSAAAKSIVAKTGNQNDYVEQIKELAKSKYANFADQIDSGLTVKQIASPYANSMSSIFEMPADSIKLDDPMMNKALTNIDPATNKPVVKPLWQFEQELKQDNRYFQTNQAHQQFADLASGIASMFGKV